MPPRRRIDPAAGERAYRLALQALRPQAGARATAAPAPVAAQAEAACTAQAEAACATQAEAAAPPPPGLSVPGLPRPELATAVRFLLEELASRAPGGSVELRVPPFGVAQLLAGPRHTRGTPPNVVETDPVTIVALAAGLLTWEESLENGRLSASGARSCLAPFFPVSGLER